MSNTQQPHDLAEWLGEDHTKFSRKDLITLAESMFDKWQVEVGAHVSTKRRLSEYTERS